MTAKEIQLIVGKRMIIAGHYCVAENISYILPGEMDVISMSKGNLIEYEVKISRGDFFRDAKKGKLFTEWLNTDMVPNYFYYVTPHRLITIDEVPKSAGLYFIIDGELRLIKKAPLLTNYKHDRAAIERKIVTVYQQRHFLGCCLMTYKNKIKKSRGLV